MTNIEIFIYSDHFNYINLLETRAFENLQNTNKKY